jgi:hypothetical protein
MAATADIKTAQYGSPDSPIPALMSIPVAAATTIYAGTMVAINSSGYAVPASADPTLKIRGVAAKQVINTVAAGYGSAGDLSVEVQIGAYSVGTPSSGANQVTSAARGKLVYASDDSTVNLTNGAGLYPVAGVVWHVEGSGAAGAKVFVLFGMPSIWESNPEITTDRDDNVVRGVVTANVASLAAFNVSTNTDGLTLVEGDLVLLVAQSTAAQNGPYVVGAVGGGTAPLTRPDWFGAGSTFYPGPSSSIYVTAGTVFAGTWWDSKKTASGVVGTDDPLFYVRRVTVAATLVAGTVTVATIPLFSATKSSAQLQLVTPNTTASTVTYSTPTLTIGAIGTASIVARANVAAGTINIADVSTLALTVQN